MKGEGRRGEPAPPCKLGPKSEQKEEGMATTEKKTLSESDLAQFTGSEQWFKHFLGPVFTEGVKHVADTAGAYWLIDSIAINQTRAEGQGRVVPIVEAASRS
jgi:hypothetical protein